MEGKMSSPNHNMNSTQKEMYRKKVKHKCEVCKKKNTKDKKDYKNRLQIHHCKHVNNGGTNRQENLILLCPEDHRRLHKITQHNNMIKKEVIKILKK